MADNSAIEWTDATWNPTVGCSVLTPGCTNCYAMKMAARLEAMGQPIYAGMTQKSKAGAVWTGKVELSNWGQVIKPLSWKKPRRIFVNSMSDLFHDALPDEAIDKVFAVMALTPQHTYQVLTKRAERMRDYCSRRLPNGKGGEHSGSSAAACRIWRELPTIDGMSLGCKVPPWPLPNVWLGVSAERQQEADERIPHLLQTPAAIRFVSAEPLLGAIDLTRISRRGADDDWTYIDDALTGFRTHKCGGWTGSKLDWIIVGGESGPNARPMHPQWARDIRDQCAAAGVAFFFKQWGEFAPLDSFSDADPDRHVYRCGKKAAGRLLDGIEHNAFPNPQPLSPADQHLFLRKGERAAAVTTGEVS